MWHFLARRPEMVSFGWLKTCMLLDRVVDILWYLFWPCSFQVLRTHFCAWVTFERFSNHRGLTWFHCDSYLNEKWFGCQASHEEEHIFLCRFMVTSILRPFWFDVFVKKSWPLPTLWSSINWNSSLVGGATGSGSQRHVDGKQFQELLIEISQGVKFPEYLHVWFWIYSIMIYYVVLLFIAPGTGLIYTFCWQLS